MTARLFKTSGTVAVPRLGKYSPLGFIANADGSSPLFAGWLLGDDYHVGAPSAGLPLTDLSGNGHTLARTGVNASAGVKAKHAIGNGNDYWTTSFTADALSASGTNNEVCVVAVAISPATAGESHSFATSVANAAGFGNRYVLAGSSSSFDVSITEHDGISAINRPFGSPVTASRSTDYFMTGANVTLSTLGAYFRNTALSPVPYTTSDLVPDGQVGGGAFRVVNSNVGTLTLKVAALMFYNRALSPAELDVIFTRVKALLANYGTTL